MAGLRDLVDQIPKDTLPLPPGVEPARNDGIMDNEVGRNINHGLNALGGMGAVTGRGVRFGAGVIDEGIRLARNPAAMRAPPVLTNAQPMLGHTAQRGADFVADAAGNVGAGPTLQRGLQTVPEATNAATGASNGVRGGTELWPGLQANQNAAAVRTASGYNAGMQERNKQPPPNMDGFMPDTRGLMRDTGDQMSSAVNRGQYGDAAWSALKGTAAMPMAIANDVVGGPLRAASAFAQGPQGPAAPAYNPNKTAETYARLGMRVPDDRASVNPAADMNTVTGKTIEDQPLLGGQRGTAVDGAPGVFKFQTADGRTLYSNVKGTTDNDKLMSNKPGMQTVPAFGGMGMGGQSGATGTAGAGGNEALARGARANEIYKEMAAINAGYDQPGAMSNGSGMRVVGGNDASFFSHADKPGEVISGATKRAREENMTRMQMAADSNYVSRANNRDTNSATMRGQDLDYGGKQATLAATAAHNKQQQANDDRRFGLDEKKYGTEVAEKNRAARIAGDQALTKEIEAMHTTKNWKGDSVVDQDAVARKKQAVTSLFGNKIAELNSVPKDHPGYAKAQALAAKLDEGGVGALGKDGLQKLMKQIDSKDIAKKAAGWSPFSGSFKESDDPSDYDIVGVDNGPFQKQYQLRGGSSVPVRQYDYANGGHHILPNGLVDNQTNSFDIIKPKGLRQ